MLRIEKKALLKFVPFLLMLTVYRVILFKFLISAEFVKQSLAPVLGLPTQAVLTVFWEDAVHTLPILLLTNLLGNTRFSKIVRFMSTVFMMLVFGTGHIYQGLFASALLMLYIPYTLKLGKKYGVGTVMVGHTAYDLVTLITLKAIAWSLNV